MLVAGCSDDESDAPSAGIGVNHEATVAAGVSGDAVRQILVESNPTTATGQTLLLTRVVVPAGQTLAPHTHPGPQMAVVSEGVLTYSVISDQVTVTRAAGSTSARTETIAAGTTTELKVGDTVNETAGMQHTARNAGTTPVVLYLSSLFPQGAPASSPAP